MTLEEKTKEIGKEIKGKLNKINEEFVKKGAEKISDLDIKKVVDKADEIKDKFLKSKTLARFVEDVKLLLSLIKDYWTGRYRDIPGWSIAVIVFTLLYVINPFDMIPDIIPGVGQLDDIAVILTCLYLVEHVLQDYKKWKENNPA
jgi:uncharacterized membrane protein YkvA (DUF1232 family)